MAMGGGGVLERAGLAGVGGCQSNGLVTSVCHLGTDFDDKVKRQLGMGDAQCQNDGAKDFPIEPREFAGILLLACIVAAVLCLCCFALRTAWICPKEREAAAEALQRDISKVQAGSAMFHCLSLKKA